jgi:hypothetical protein
MPPTIPPTASEIQEIHKHLSGFEELTYQEVEPTFTFKVPDGYYWMYPGVNHGINAPGAGDLLHNLVGSEALPFSVIIDRGMQISQDVWDSWSTAYKQTAKRMIPEIKVNNGIRQAVVIDRNSIGLKTLGNLRAFLLNEDLFPLWTVSTVTKNSLENFQLKHVSGTQTPRNHRRERIL